MKSKPEELPTNDEVFAFIRSNLDKLPVCYLLLTPYKAEVYSAKMAVGSQGELRGNLGGFYKPISDILNEPK
ncbi:MAG TPA: hypothetical protein PK563_12285 [Tenuifilaceae bacterium]|nr:hypothetical protein [Tenuifilaceae bacterium]